MNYIYRVESKATPTPLSSLILVTFGQHQSPCLHAILGTNVLWFQGSYKDRQLLQSSYTDNLYSSSQYYRQGLWCWPNVLEINDVGGRECFALFIVRYSMDRANCAIEVSAQQHIARLSLFTRVNSNSATRNMHVPDHLLSRL